MNKPKVRDLVDENDCVVRVTATTDESSLWRRCVHVFLIGDNGDILICKRPATKRAYPGLWSSAAGGHVELGETYGQAAARELREELDLTLELRDLGRFDVKDEHGNIIHHLFVGRHGGLKATGPECCESKWVEPRAIQADVIENSHAYAESFRRALALYFEAYRGETR
jgi:8-oxo-dGTP pyrophosphatase MutT (NUDIX family)